MINYLNKIASVSSRLQKEKLISECYDTDLLKKIVQYTYSPESIYGIKKYPKPHDMNLVLETGIDKMFDLLDKLKSRELTGNAAKESCVEFASSVIPSTKELFDRIISHNLKIGCGPETFNKVLGPVVYIHPYRRCSSFSKKNLSRIIFPAISQVKEDGAYNDIIVSSDGIKIMSRNGLEPSYSLPQGLMAAIKQTAENYVLMGECRVWKEDRSGFLPREESNGKLSSLDIDPSRICMILWDCVPVNEFSDTSVSSEGEITRLSRLINIINTVNEIYPSDQFKLINYKIVSSADEIINHFRECIERGDEGTVVKNMNALWKSCDSPDCVKIKIIFDCDLIIDSVIEGTGKNIGRMGSLRLKTCDDKLFVNVGIGFSDQQREDIWNGRDEILNCCVTIKANEVLSKDETASLFLPRMASQMEFVEIRKDKLTGDTYDRVLQQRDSVYDIIASMTKE